MGLEAAALVGGEFGRLASHGRRVQHTSARYGERVCVKLTTLEKYSGQLLRYTLHI
jgi:hypothetical protein